MSDLRATIKVHGLVQGVFFREGTQKRAQALGLTGYVENEPGGTVKIAAEGEKANLEKLIEWLKIGTDLAKVDRIEVEWSSPTDTFKDFLIRG